jgi:glycosyltransferase involved in cell wall biosynthesis
MKLAVVVQRYGPAISGGAELHARYIAERLAKHAQVDVLTTCATDYITWRNELPAGDSAINGVTVRRFKVKHERDPNRFGQLQELVFTQRHSIADELDWLDAEGPASDALIDYLSKRARDYDFVIFFSYRYYHAYHGIHAVPSRAILVPTAERDETIGLGIFPPLFRSVRALMYNSPEERQMIQAVSRNEAVPSVVVGVGSEVPNHPQPARFRSKYNVRGPFAIYVGRIDVNKGCQELFDFYQAYAKHTAGKLGLVLVGHTLLDIPKHPRIRHIGFLDDTEKFDAMAAAELLIMPSYYESLSMVALEAWALGKPVLANGRCDVLKGQCLRSNAGLFYESLPEFIETLTAMERQRWLSQSLGKNGRQFFKDHYDWPVIERKYLQMFEQLQAQPATPASDKTPGWRDRRREDVPPAAETLAAVPSGPASRREAPQAAAVPRRA